MSIELLFDVNDFNEPAYASGSDADALLLHNVLLGRDDSHITRGVGFNIQKYRFKEITNSVGEITTELNNHCAKYVPHIYIDSLQAQTTTGENIILLINIKNLTSGESKNVYFNITSTSTKMLVDIM